jgi:hypothetical protein
VGWILPKAYLKFLMILRNPFGGQGGYLKMCVARNS